VVQYTVRGHDLPWHFERGKFETRTRHAQDHAKFAFAPFEMAPTHFTSGTVGSLVGKRNDKEGERGGPVNEVRRVVIL